MATASVDKNASQNQPVNWAESNAPSSWTRARCWFISRLLTPAATRARIASGERFSERRNHAPAIMTANISKGIRNKSVWSCRARSHPLRVS